MGAAQASPRLGCISLQRRGPMQIVEVSVVGKMCCQKGRPREVIRPDIQGESYTMLCVHVIA